MRVCGGRAGGGGNKNGFTTLPLGAIPSFSDLSLLCHLFCNILLVLSKQMRHTFPELWNLEKKYATYKFFFLFSFFSFF